MAAVQRAKVTLKAGDILVMPSDAYYTARMLANGFSQHSVRKYGQLQRQIMRSAHVQGVKLLWLESPAIRVWMAIYPCWQRPATRQGARRRG
jgi:cystathionine beta-lyase/cystathionine gamma-synthase